MAASVVAAALIFSAVPPPDAFAADFEGATTEILAGRSGGRMGGRMGGGTRAYRGGGGGSRNVYSRTTVVRPASPGVVVAPVISPFGFNPFFSPFGKYCISERGEELNC